MGLYTIAGILKTTSVPSQQTLDIVGERLRLLAHVVEPVRDDPLQLPTMDAPTQNDFFETLMNKFEALGSILSPKPPAKSEMTPAQATQAAVLMARLLQFDLAFRGVWTPKTRQLSGKMCEVVFDLALVSDDEITTWHWLTFGLWQAHGAGDHLNPIAFPLLLDTYCYLLDGMLVFFFLEGSECFHVD